MRKNLPQALPPLPQTARPPHRNTRQPGCYPCLRSLREPTPDQPEPPILSRPHRSLPLWLLAALWLPSSTRLSLAAPVAACSSIPHGDHPQATIHGGPTTAVLFLPDKATGYYRGSRFDWAGVVPCLSYRGHTFFGEWFTRYDPLLHDSITGPVEEFRSDDGALGYDAAAPGGTFVKIGVGVLRRPDASPFQFATAYPLVDGGTWTTAAAPDRVTFTQILHAPGGVAYRYQKVLRLDSNGALILEHSLTNLGASPIVTDVYNHDFYMLDGRPTGPGFRIHFAFTPTVAASPAGKADGTLEPSATIQGNDIVYTAPLAPHQTVASYLTGYSGSPSDFDITVSDATSGISVRETGDRPIHRLYLWSIPSTIAPEAYIHLNVAPGATEHWSLRFAFHAQP